MLKFGVVVQLLACKKRGHGFDPGLLLSMDETINGGPI